MREELKHIIESLLFVSDAPLSVQRIRSILDLVHKEAVTEALQALHEEYEERRGGFYLSEVAGGFQLRSRPEHRQWIQKMLQNRPARLSKAALETLAIIAYKQPVIRSDVEYIRGVDCGGVLRILLERKLVKVLGRKEIPGRPMIYATTRKFLELFDLKDLKDLPSPKEVAEFGKEHPEPPSESLNKEKTDDSAGIEDSATDALLRAASDSGLYRGRTEPEPSPFQPEAEAPEAPVLSEKHRSKKRRRRRRRARLMQSQIRSDSRTLMKSDAARRGVMGKKEGKKKKSASCRFP